MEAKASLEEELINLKSQQAEAVATRSKAEQDLEFEQEVRRAAALSRDEAEKHLESEKRSKADADEALITARENLAAAVEGRRKAEDQAARDREALRSKEEEVMAFRIQLGEKEAEVRHAGKMENLRCSVEIEKLKSELEWKTRMLRTECEDLEHRLEDSDRMRRNMERALGEANNEMRVRKKEGELMKKMLDELVSRTEGARSSQDVKAQELQQVRESIMKLKDQAGEQLSALANMKEYDPAEYFEEKRGDRRRNQQPQRGRAYLEDDYGGRHGDAHEPRPPPRDSGRRSNSRDRYEERDRGERDRGERSDRAHDRGDRDRERGDKACDRERGDRSDRDKAYDRGDREKSYDRVDRDRGGDRDRGDRDRGDRDRGDRDKAYDRGDKAHDRDRGERSDRERHGRGDRRGDPVSPGNSQHARSERGGGRGRGDLDVMFNNDDELDQQIRQIEDELTIKLPPLAPGRPQAQDPPKKSRAGAGREPARRGVAGGAQERGERGRRR